METATKSEQQTARIGVTLDLGIYWGWMSLVFFSTSLVGNGGTDDIETANFIALAVSTVVVATIAFLSPALARRVEASRALRITATLAATSGTLLVLWAASSDALLTFGACLVGIPEGLLLYLFVSQALRRCPSAEEVVVLFSWALIIAAALYLVVVLLGAAADIACALLPLLSLGGLLIHTPSNSAGTVSTSSNSANLSQSESTASFWTATRKLPWKLLFGLAVFGIAFGLMRVSASTASIEVFQTSYLAHTLARAGTALVALVLVGRMGKAYWTLSTLQLLAFTLGICSYWMPLESTAILTVAATTAGYTCLELMLWAVLFELSHETSVAFNTLYGIVRGLVSLATLIATGFSLFVMASMPATTVHVVLLFFLLAMILVSSLLFGSRNVASLWGLERSAMAPETVNSEQITQALSKRHGLTARETEVMGLLMKGRNEPFISEALFISPSTTHSHVSHIYAKIGVHSRQELLSVIDKEFAGNSNQPK